MGLKWLESVPSLQSGERAASCAWGSPSRTQVSRAERAWASRGTRGQGDCSGVNWQWGGLLPVTADSSVGSSTTSSWLITALWSRGGHGAGVGGCP